MKRRDFIRSAAFTAFAVSTMGCTVTKPNGDITGDCETTTDILGPFYRQNAPFREDLRINEKGAELLTINGQVFQGDCKTPLEDAIVDIWHANTDGDYDNDSDEYRYRGRIKVGKDGKYSFQTIMPGRYLNGQLYRPSHIHFRVTGGGHKQLISQIYFKGDPYIETDPWASDEKAELRILELLEDKQSAKTKVVNFDIYLASKA